MNDKLPPWAYSNPYKPQPMKASQRSVKKQAKVAIANDDLPPGQRKSFQDQVYPDATEAHWEKFPNVGWVHALEKDYFNYNFRQCYASKKWFHKGGMYLTTDEKHVSAEAIDGMPSSETVGAWDDTGKRPYRRCPVTGSIFRSEDAVVAIGTNYETVKVHKDALENYFKDDIDGLLYPHQLRVVVKFLPGVKQVAKRTLMNSGKLTQCANCSNVGGLDYAKLNHGVAGYMGHSMCNPCIDKIMAKNVIQSHDSKEYPEPKYRISSNWRVIRGKSVLMPMPPPVRLFGAEVELEYDWQTSSMSRVQHALAVRKALGQDFIAIKHDGSLSGTTNSQGPGTGGCYGFELVTGPCDLATHRENWPSIMLAAGYKKLRAWDTKTCGFHVHVSKAALTTLQIGRILSFVNHPNNKSFIQKVAGRSEEKYCKYFPKKASDSLHPEQGDYNERRRVAVNLQNPHTIEFRIFRGTINPKHILRNIEFCDALCDFCHPASRSFADTMDPFKFMKFVELERCCEVVDNVVVKKKKWPLLYAWLEFHEAIKPRPPRPDTPSKAGVKPKSPKTPVKKLELLVSDTFGEPEVKSKYVSPAKLIAHSIGVK